MHGTFFPKNFNETHFTSPPFKTKYTAVAVLQTLAAIPTLPCRCRTYKLLQISEAFIGQAGPTYKTQVCEESQHLESSERKAGQPAHAHSRMSVAPSSALSGDGFRTDPPCLCSLNTE